MTGKNRMIYGPKDGTFVVEFRAAEVEPGATWVRHKRTSIYRFFRYTCIG
jgi:hypothetical protein